MIRLFIALPLQKQVEDGLGRIIATLQDKGGKVKWVAPKNIHLTIKFLGNTEESLVKSLKEHIDEVAAGFQPLTSRIDRIGAFPNLNRPRVIWASFSECVEILAKMAGMIDERVHALGWEREERKFKPHLTLGRVKDSSGMEELAAFVKSYELPDIPLNLDRLVLFKSTLTQRGPIYERLHERMLGSDQTFGG